jgi:hypothetical protein
LNAACISLSKYDGTSPAENSIIAYVQDGLFVAEGFEPVVSMGIANARVIDTTDDGVAKLLSFHNESMDWMS